MAFEIIPQDLYLSVGQDNYLNPSWFNSVFNNVNAHSMNNNLFTRPVAVVADTQAIFWKEDNVGDFASIAPEIIKLKEVGSDMMPGGWSATYQWIFPEQDSLFALVDGYDGTEKEIEIEIASDLTESHTILDDLAAFTLQLQVTYTDLNNISTTSVATYGFPIVPILDGAPAITTPKALIWIDSQHKPLDAPGGSATFNVEDISYYPPSGTNSEGSPWTLSLGGVSKNQYIQDNNDGTALITIPEVGKTFELTLTVTSGTTVTKTINIRTYDYGSFLFSSWGQETPVDAPKKVIVSGTNKVKKDSDQLFPANSSVITVKWGKNIDDVSRLNTGDKTGEVFCIPGISSDNTYKNAVRSVMTEYGLGANETVENYSIIQVNDADTGQAYEAGGHLIGQYFWAENMAENAKILFKSTNSTLTVTGNPLISDNSLYLIRGVAPTGTQGKVAVSSGAERYYIKLESFSIDPTSGVYSRSYQYDQYAVVSQGGKAAPVEAVFMGMPLNTAFKARVIGAKGSAYSIEKASEGYYTLSSSDIASQIITSITASPSQYGLSISMSIDGTKEQPAGYLINYIEMNPNVSWPAGTEVSLGGALSGVTSVYTISPTVGITAAIGKKVVASARAVMADGSIGGAVTLEPTTVNVPWSYLESGISKHLGRYEHTAADDANTGPSYLEDLSPISSIKYQSNLFNTSFGRDVFIESVVIWIYSCNFTIGAGQIGDYQIVLQSDSLTDANDEKVVKVALDTEYNSNNVALTPGIIPVGSTKKYVIPDLSIPVTAGSDVIIAMQGHGVGSTINIGAEIHYSNGTIITSTTPSADKGTAG
tara:strand:+ start:15204 stop:17666 length:2463 start_codon:yes stop_codon:yes gene_type:complete